MIGALATLFVLVFIASLIRHHVYAPGARRLQQDLYFSDPFALPLFESYAFGNFVFFAIRKLYGTITFTIVAFFVSSIFARPVRFRRTVLLMTIARAALEVVERLLHRGDSIGESLFDTATGTLAGILGALAYNAVTKRSETA